MLFLMYNRIMNQELIINNYSSSNIIITDCRSSKKFKVMSNHLNTSYIITVVIFRYLVRSNACSTTIR